MHQAHDMPDTAPAGMRLSAPFLPEREGLPLFLSAVQACFPSPADDSVEDRLDLHRHLVRNDTATFFLHACGDSMEGAGIRDGDLLVVDRSLEPRSGRTVIAAVGGELTVKRRARRDGRTLLVPANPGYPEFDVTDREDLCIWGVVTYAVHKL